MNPVRFLREVRSETKKVHWPSRKETTQSAIAVFIMVVIATIFLFVVDQALAWVIRLILGV